MTYSIKLIGVINDDLLALQAMFAERGFDIRLVGGAVRDILNDCEPNDIDLCTDAFPQEQLAIYSDNGLHFIPTGVDHGTYTVVMNNISYEITSLRTESEHDGRYAKMAFTRDWNDDLGRRDLTINAMAMTFAGELIDPYGGLADLQNGVVRFVGDAYKRMTEDYLRVLRYFRFLGRFSNIEDEYPQIPVTEIKACVYGLTTISVERIWSEVSKMVQHPSGGVVYELMAEMGVIKNTPLPEASAEQINQFKLLKKLGHTNAAMLMCSFFTDSPHAEKVSRALKWSSDERELAKHVMSYKNPSIDDLRYQWLVKDRDPQHIAMAGAFHGCSVAFLQESKNVFPVTGGDLIATGMKPGPQMGKVITEMKDRWFQSNCTMTKDELIGVA